MNVITKKVLSVVFVIITGISSNILFAPKITSLKNKDEQSEENNDSRIITCPLFNICGYKKAGSNEKKLKDRINEHLINYHKISKDLTLQWKYWRNELTQFAFDNKDPLKISEDDIIKCKDAKITDPLLSLKIIEPYILEIINSNNVLDEISKNPVNYNFTQKKCVALKKNLYQTNIKCPLFDGGCCFSTNKYSSLYMHLEYHALPWYCSECDDHFTNDSSKKHCKKNHPNTNWADIIQKNTERLEVLNALINFPRYNNGKPFDLSEDECKITKKILSTNNHISRSKKETIINIIKRHVHGLLLKTKNDTLSTFHQEESDDNATFVDMHKEIKCSTETEDTSISFEDFLNTNSLENSVENSVENYLKN